MGLKNIKKITKVIVLETDKTGNFSVVEKDRYLTMGMKHEVFSYDE